MPLLSDLAVYVATPSDGYFPIETLCSYLDTQEACLKHGIKIDFGFVTCSLIHFGRTELANDFLKRKEFNRLFWIDSDIKWSPVDFVKVLAHTLKHECVVGAYPRRDEPLAFYIKVDASEQPNDDGLVRIQGTGLGFACVTRKVMEEMAVKAPALSHSGREPVPSIFRCDSHNGEARGEDYAFWSDVADLGYSIYADATITLGHVGRKVYQSALAAR